MNTNLGDDLMYNLQLKRAYDDIQEDDGYRVLVDRLWPRGIKKENLEHDWWPKELAPTSDLRKEYDHDEDKFNWFKKEYKKELNNNEDKEDFLSEIKSQLNNQPVTLLFAAKDYENNHAVILKEWIENKLDL